MTELLFGRYAKDLLTTLYRDCRNTFNEKLTEESKQLSYDSALLSKGQLIGAVMCCNIYQPKYQGYLVLNISELSDKEMFKFASPKDFANDYLKNTLRIDLEKAEADEEEDDEECER